MQLAQLGKLSCQVCRRPGRLAGRRRSGPLPRDAGAASTCWPWLFRPRTAQNWSTVCRYDSAGTRPRRYTAVAARILSTVGLCPGWSWRPKWQIGHTRYSFPPYELIGMK